MKVLVTGGAGFIGNTLVRHLLRPGCAVANADALTCAAAFVAILERGEPRTAYAIRSRDERRNIDVAQDLFTLPDASVPDGAPHAQLIAHVADRPGHDRRYAVDPSRIEQRLGWKAASRLGYGLAATVDWYLAHRGWWQARLAALQQTLVPTEWRAAE